MASLLQPIECGAKRPAEKVPEPLLSSQDRHWTGILVQHYRARDVDMERQTPAHVVTVFLRGPVDLVQGRYGRVFQRRMHAGDIIVAPAGGPKELRHEDEAEVVKIWLDAGYAARIADDVVATSRERIALLDNFGTRDSDVEAIARRLLREMQTNALSSRLYADCLATELVVHLLRHYSTKKTLATDPAPALPQSKLQRVTDYMNDNLAEDLPLERLSAMLHMSPWHFAHAFKRTTGLAPHRYLLQRRIERAMCLLRGTDLSISEVANRVGYSHQSNFSVAFRRSTGQPPRAFRGTALR